VDGNIVEIEWDWLNLGRGLESRRLLRVLGIASLFNIETFFCKKRQALQISPSADEAVGNFLRK
jgi:hypothetical protein